MTCLRLRWDARRVPAEKGQRVCALDIRRIIRSAGYTLKKAREVLGSNDPDYQEELAKLQSIRPSTPDGR